MSTYNLDTIASDGTAQVTITVDADHVYVQQLCGLPVNNEVALKAVLDAYASDLVAGITAEDAPPPVAVAPLVDNPQQIT